MQVKRWLAIGDSGDEDGTYRQFDSAYSEGIINHNRALPLKEAVLV